MHYSFHPPRTFRSRSARYLGVLVGAALVATLGLPSAVQAQPPGMPSVAYDARSANGNGGRRLRSTIMHDSLGF